MESLPSFRRAVWGLMTLAAITVAGLNSRFIWIDVPRIMHRATDHLGRDDFELFLHLWTAPLILVTGALLLPARLRTRFPRAHRWAGRFYLGSVLLTSIATLRLALHETEGPLTVFGFTVLSVLWFGTAAMAWMSAMRGRFEEHGAWMVRNYALTLTNVTFRLELHVMLLFGVPFTTVYEPVRVLQWIPNLIIAEALIRSGFFAGENWKALGPKQAGVKKYEFRKTTAD
jgi:Predicted membrane protein (DUF2306)